MKRIIISMLAIATLAGCSKIGRNTDSNELVPIKLHSGIASKAPITGSETVTIACWESSTGSATYTNEPTWTSTAAVSVGASAASITLNPVRYYNADKDIKSYVKGWFPAIAPSSGVVTFTNTDGSVDAILSNEVNGSES